MSFLLALGLCSERYDWVYIVICHVDIEGKVPL